MKKVIKEKEKISTITTDELDVNKHVVLAKTPKGEPMILQMSIQDATSSSSYFAFHSLSKANIRMVYGYKTSRLSLAVERALDCDVEIMVTEKDNLAAAYLWALGEDQPAFTMAENFLRRIKNLSPSDEAKIIRSLTLDCVILTIVKDVIHFEDGSQAIWNNSSKTYSSKL